MSSLQSQIDEADLHVEQAKERIAIQSALIVRLTVDGRPTDAAERLLDTFIQLLGTLTTHRDALSPIEPNDVGEDPQADDRNGENDV